MKYCESLKNLCTEPLAKLAFSSLDLEIEAKVFLKKKL
jgi:hypothetical protein